jgi:hypothetical protein
MKAEKQQSNRMRIGIIVASVIVGVILALLSMLSPH